MNIFDSVFCGKPLMEIPQCMPRLRRLYVTESHLVPNELLFKLASIMPQLMIIDMYGEVISPEYLAGEGYNDLVISLL